MGEEHSGDPEDRYFFLENQEVVVIDCEASGSILDIGGGGEGIIPNVYYYQEIAEGVELRFSDRAENGQVFYMEFQKP